MVTDGAGDFRKPITVPPDLAEGAHTAVAQGVAPDDTTFQDHDGREFAPRGADWDAALAGLSFTADVTLESLDLMRSQPGPAGPRYTTLLAAPLGSASVIGVDPGLRTGVKVAVVDATGQVLDHGAIFPTPPQNRIQEAEAVLLHLCQKHKVGLIAIGNGTASRETDKFVGDFLKRHKEIKAQKVMVNESGASVYSASEFAAKEFPDLDVTIRGAISIARRLQDPLAELVKIEPKSIGVGQYQHDVSQSRLGRALDAVIEDCVNAVGVEVNTASVPLLARVAGLNQTIANNIVEFRNKNGALKNRKQLLEVARLGAKAFEQAAGFLRIANGENPLGMADLGDDVALDM